MARPSSFRERDGAAVRPPILVSHYELELLPLWGPLRGEPCFEKIVASLAPK